MVHIPVLLNECIEGLNIKPGGVFVDGTFGGGGHAKEIIKRMGSGLFIGIDKDETAILRNEAILCGGAVKTVLSHNNFSDLKQIIEGLNLNLSLDINKIDGCLLDLGVSSFMFDEAARGFSYIYDGPLDMRMDKSSTLTAFDVVNTYSKERLREVIQNYGEDRWAARIAEFIVAGRQTGPIETTFGLVSIIKKAIPKKAREDGHHPAKRTFQAIRIEVNNELEVLRKAIYDITDVLNTGGRLAVITFHSLEYKIVKKAFKHLAANCVCPREFPVCVCGKKREIDIITKKPITPTEDEIKRNTRARSARLLVAEKI